MKNHLIYGKLHFSQFDRSHTFQTDFNVTSAESNDESSVCLNWINLWLEIGWLFTILYLISSWFNQVFSELLNDAFLADSPENMYFRIVTENQPLCMTSSIYKLQPLSVLHLHRHLSLATLCCWHVCDTMKVEVMSKYAQ